MNWRLWFVPGLIAAIAVLLLIALRANENDTDSTVAAAPGVSGYVATNAELVQTDEQGAELYQVTAPRIVQADPDSNIQLTQPHVRYHDTNRGNWTLVAASGELPPLAREIELRGRVEVSGLQARSEEPMTLRTDHLHVDLDRQTAVTDALVFMDWKRTRVTGRGMALNLLTRHLQLHADTHGEIAR